MNRRGSARKSRGEGEGLIGGGEGVSVGGGERSELDVSLSGSTAESIEGSGVDMAGRR